MADQLTVYISQTDTGQYQISCTIETEWAQTGDLENESSTLPIKSSAHTIQQVISVSDKITEESYL